METTVIQQRPELLQVADTVAREKGIDREEVIEAMEQAIQKAGRSKYGHELDIRAQIDRQSGEIHLYRYREIAEEIENEATQILPGEAKEDYPDLAVGEFIVDPLPPIDFGRIAAQTAKQVIVQKVREAERSRQYAEYKDRVGEIVNGLVKRVEFGNVMIDLGRGEAILKREELIPRESFRQNDRVRAYIYDVREETRGPQIFLSRTHPQFMASLFAQEVPEIYDSIIEIKAVARDPGSRAKIAVLSNDSSIDPVGACVGMRGSRVQAVVGELQGEKIDIIPWSPDSATFVVNALAPAEVTKVVLDEDAGSLEIVVPDDQLSLAIGRRGQNVRLASQLSGWHIDILTEAEESERRQEEFRVRSQLFIDSLDIDDVIAHLLVTEGFSTLEEVAFIPVEELSGIEGFDEDVAEELRQRAQTFLAERDAALTARRKELGVADELAELEGMSPTILVALGEGGVKALDDLADLTADDVRFLMLEDLEVKGEHTLDDLAQMDARSVAILLSGSPLSAVDADALIMASRAHWFGDEEQADEDAAKDAPEGTVPEETATAETATAETAPEETATGETAPEEAAKDAAPVGAAEAGPQDETK